MEYWSTGVLGFLPIPDNWFIQVLITTRTNHQHSPRQPQAAKAG